MFMFFTFLGVVLLYCLCWNMKETKRFEFGKGSVRKFKFQVEAALEGTSDACRAFSCGFACCPTKQGYFELTLGLWIPFVSLNLYWGNSDSPESENKL
jgi:hypothetical protein